MSVTIWIEDDDDKSIIDEYNCHWCDINNPNPKCSECKGEGVIRFFSSRWEMNLSNGNFYHFWKNLGLEPNEYLCGNLDAPAVITALYHNEHLPGVTHYVDRIIEIANEALKRNKRVIWG